MVARHHETFRRPRHNAFGRFRNFTTTVVNSESAEEPHRTPYLDAFVRQRHAARDGQTEAAELVRRVAHADADLDAAIADIVEYCEVLGQPKRMVERQQTDVAR